MTVIVKGMKMPEKCQYCGFLAYYANSGNVWCNATNRLIETGWHTEIDIKRQADCPLVEIPPHGRLIDADELIEVCEAWRCEAQKRDAFINLILANAVIAQVKLQPTVIEAEEDREE